MCIFCKIIKKEIPANIIFEDEKVLGFKDLNPQANVHLLFIHKFHDENINQMSEKNPEHLKDVFSAIQKYSIKSEINKTGFRVVTNLGKDAGQTVFHTHFHVLAGEPLGHFGR
jgi:histidine triad (HIT) family protein